MQRSSQPQARLPQGMVLFAEDFDLDGQDPGGDAEPETIVPSYTAAELDEARRAGFAAGRQAGVEEARASQLAATTDALGAIAAALGEACAQASRHAEEAAAAPARRLLSALAAQFPARCRHHGSAEVVAVARAVLPELLREPEVSVRVSPHDAEALRQEIGRLEAGLAARLQLIPTDAMARGDIAIAWQDGAASRDGAALWRAVAEALGSAGLLDAAAMAPAAFAQREMQDVG